MSHMPGRHLDKHDDILNLDDLVTALVEEWRATPQEYIRQVVRSMRSAKV